MSKNPQFDKLIEQIDQVAQTGRMVEGGDVDESHQDVLETAVLLAKAKPVDSGNFKDRLKRELMDDFAASRKLPLAQWKWPKLGSGIKRTQAIALLATLSIVLLGGAALAVPLIREMIFKPTTGNIELYSEPSGAAVILDGKPKGVTPLSLRELETGAHQLSMSLDNNEDWSGNITVKENKTIRVTVNLTGIEVVEIDKKTGRKTANSKQIADGNQDKESTSGQAKVTPFPEAVVPNTGPGGATVEEIDQADSSTKQQTGQVPPSEPAGKETQSPTGIAGPLIIGVKGGNLVYFDGKEKIIASIGRDNIGKEIVFVVSGSRALWQTGPGTINLVDFTSQAMTVENLYTSKSAELLTGPSWSGGDSVVFGIFEKESGKCRLVELDIKTGQETVIARDTVIGAAHITNKLLVIQKDDGLYVCDRVLGTEKRVFKGSAAKVLWSPNGKKVAFSGSTTDGIDGTGLYIVDYDGSNLVELDRDAISFKWSPNSERLAYEVKKNIIVSLYLYDTQTSAKSRMIDGTYSPVFDSTDNCICYIKQDNAKQNSIYLLRLDELVEQELVAGADFVTLLYAQDLI